MDYFKEMKRSLRKKLGTSETKKLLSRAVYLIAIGSNDYGAFDPQSNLLYQFYTTQQYVDSVIGNMTTFIKVNTSKIKLILLSFYSISLILGFNLIT